MLWQLHPVPTIHNDPKSNPSFLKTFTISMKSPRKLKIGVDELVLLQTSAKIVDIGWIFEQNSSENFTSKKLDNSVKCFNLKCNGETGIFAVHECISIDRNLQFVCHIMF